MRRVRGTLENATEAARELRQRETPAESVLWEYPRSRRLRGLKFRRQHPIGTYFVDFCCPERRLIVELDGDVHQGQADQDAARTEHLEAYGYSVIRFPNIEVANNIDQVLETIADVAFGSAAEH